MTDGLGRATEGKRILVVERDPWMRQIIRWALEDEGLVVAEAVDARQALAAIGRVRPAVVVLDHGLPDQDGSALADMLRSILGWDAPPIVLATADGRAAERAARTGAAA